MDDNTGKTLRFLTAVAGTVLMFAMWTSLSCDQSARFDLDKCQQELEICKGLCR